MSFAQILFFHVVNLGRILSIVLLGGKHKRKKKETKAMMAGSIRYWKKEEKGKPETNTKKNKMQIINITVDKFDGKIKIHVIKLGIIIYR